MYITIVFLPFWGAILSGLYGRALGVKGVHIINVSCLLITTLLAFIAYYEVVLCNSPVSVELFSWINSEHLKISWGFYFDQLTVNMLIPVLIVSLLVHVYSIGYMGEDPHQQRFFSYISLFTGLMLVLVTGNNFLVMFLGWEGVGVCSYLLVHFWYTRVAAVKSALNAMFTNRVGDYFLTLGFFAIFYTFGTLDYATVFSIAPYINTNVITFISILLLLGAAAKSAQIGLHQWLPMAMEGWYFSHYIWLFINLPFRTNNNLSLLYDYNGCSVNYSTARNLEPANIEDALIGDLLGDGHLRFHGKSTIENNKKVYTCNARMEFTFSTPNLPYLRHLKHVLFLLKK
jgi:NADH:ubiquinone oxidoreductase subunit 4 (subunit M)